MNLSQLLHVLGLAALAYLGLAAYVFIMQARYVYFPDRTIDLTPADMGMPFEKIDLRREDGTGIAGWFVPAPAEPRDNAMPPGFAVLFCHGNAGDIGDRVGSLRTFHDLGFAVLIFDYAGYGESEGRPTEAGTYQDAWAAWRHLTGERGIPPGRVVIFGRSLGGGVAAWLATQASPGAVILESTFTSAADMAAGMFPYLPARLVCRFGYDSLSRVAGLTCPVMIAHSPDDGMVPLTHGRRLMEAAREPKQFVEFRGDHNAGGLDTNPEYQQALTAFVRKHCLDADRK